MLHLTIATDTVDPIHGQRQAGRNPPLAVDPVQLPWVQRWLGERDCGKILAVVMLANLVGPLVMFSIGALAPLLRDSLALSREQVGYLAALFFSGTAVVSIPAGRMADRFGVRLPLIAAQVVGGLPLAAIAFVGTYHMLLPVMFLAGLAYGTITVVTTKAVSVWFPRNRRATAMGLKLAGLGLSGVVAGAMIPTLAVWVGWPQAFSLLGGIMLASALLNLLLYYDPPQHGPNADPRPASGPQCSVLHDRNFRRQAAAGFFFAGSQFAFTTYLALFLHERLGIGLILAASLLAQTQLCGVAGRVLHGLVSDRWLNGERGRLLLGVATLAISPLLALLLVPYGTSYLVLSALMILYGVSGLGWGALHFTLVTELAGPQSTGMGVGIAMSLCHAGAAVTPPLVGYVVDATGSYAISWGLLMLWLMVGIGLVSCVQTAPVGRRAGVMPPAPVS